MSKIDDLAERIEFMSAESKRLHDELKSMLSDDPAPPPRLLSAENWLRQSAPMLKGAAHDVRTHIQENPKP